MTHPFVTTLRAFHGNTEIKATYLARVEAHAFADEIQQGFYWENGKGCAVGCTIHGSDHARYETELGIPRLLARLEDRLFETLKNGDAKAWPRLFLDAIPVGADLSLVWPQWALWMLTDETHGVRQYARTARTRGAVDRVAALYRRVVNGDAVPQTEFTAAAAAAAAAADADAYAADAAAYAADAAAAAAAYAAAAAAYAAAAYAAAYAAAAAARSRFALAASQQLAELLRAAPVPETVT